VPLFFSDLLEPGILSDFAWPTSKNMKNHKIQVSLARLNSWWSGNIKPDYCLTSIEVVLSDNKSKRNSAVVGGNENVPR
jgi:hypothetical protein